MSVEKEIQRYWDLSKKYHQALTPVGKMHVASVEISSLYLRAKSEKVQAHCSNILLQEGIAHDESESENSGS